MKVYAVLLQEGTNNVGLDRACLGIFKDPLEADCLESYIRSYFEEVYGEYDFWTDVQEFELDTLDETCLKIMKEVDDYEERLENDKENENDGNHENDKDLVSITYRYKNGNVIEKKIVRG